MEHGGESPGEIEEEEEEHLEDLGKLMREISLSTSNVSMETGCEGHGPGDSENHGGLASITAGPMNISSSSSSSSSLSFHTVPSDVDVLLADGSLVLDIYPNGSGALASLWQVAAEHLQQLQQLRMGSEDEETLETALSVLQHLRQLRSLAIRGHCHLDSLGEPRPGLLSSVPDSLSSLIHLTHLDLSFNLLSILPASLPFSLCSLILSYNSLSSLPPTLGSLHSLTHLYLIGNQLSSLPPSLGQLEMLQMLDVSHNQLESVPEELGHLVRLFTLELSDNRLCELPDSLGDLQMLQELVLHTNHLRSIPESLSRIPQLRLDVRNNPIGRPATPPALPAAPDLVEKCIPEVHLSATQHHFQVSPAGCHVFLPKGVELLFPPGCVDHTMPLQWAEKRPNRKWVWLEEHDFLLSCPLELCPHGACFLKPVDVCLPHRHRKRREVVVRRFDGHTWSTLSTFTRRGSPNNSVRPGGKLAWLACSSVSHFSWFVAVSRPIQDSCSVSPEGTLLVSSADPAVKLHFPPSATEQTRLVTLQVLQMSASIACESLRDPHASVSPLLCLTQTPDLPFLQPVQVQLPLPPDVTGHTVDESRLRLLHGDPASHVWTDITAQTSLRVTHLYAIFTITHFSWYWLWYTTQRCVSGVVRKVYHRLRQFHVQFLVMQKKTDPEQVLLQCLPSNKVEKSLQCLCGQYEGPQPSDLCELLEGEQFYAAFEKGIDVITDRPDCVGGRLCFIFYSHLKNHKEVYIQPTEGEREPVRGQVSFYRGDVPSDVPQEAIRKRKVVDNQWLATLILRLPGRRSDVGTLEEYQSTPLQLGDPENGFLTEANLLAISLQVAQDWQTVGIHLGFSLTDLTHLEYKHRCDLRALVLEMLFTWARRQSKADPAVITSLIKAMAQSGRQDLADEIVEIVELGKSKYQHSLKRVGLPHHAE